MESILKNLNPAQREAVSQTEGALGPHEEDQRQTDEWNASIQYNVLHTESSLQV